MNIVTAEENDRERFDLFVADHPTGTFLQTWAWGEWQTHQKKTVERFLFTDDGSVVGVGQAILTNTPLGNYFYLPYGPLWSVDLPKSDIVALFDSLKKELSLPNVLCVRIEPTVKFDVTAVRAVKAEAIQPPQTLIKDISASEEDLLSSLHHKTRYNIKVAQKHGVTVTTHDRPNKEVISLIMQTAARQKYRGYSPDYIDKLWNFFATNDLGIKATGYLAIQNDTPLASGLMIDSCKTRMYLFGGSDYAHRNLMAPYLLHWQAMRDAKNSGKKYYDFGASENASGHTGGYMRFKLGFNPDILEFGGTHDLVIAQSKYKLYKLARKLNRLWLHLPHRK